VKKKILVIGGTGFIGYHLLKKTTQLGWISISASRSAPQKFRKVKKVKYLKINLQNSKDIKSKLKGKYDFVVNLIGNSEKSYITQIKNLINFFSNKQIIKFIHIGSSAEYGNIKKLPHKENLNCKPNSVYGKKKLKITNFFLKKYKKFFIPITILRLFQVYGLNDNKNKILPYVLENCLKNNKFNLTKGNQTRDFCNIEDVTRAIILLLKTTNKRIYGEIFNIGTGKSITIKKLVKIIQKKTNGGKPIFGTKALKNKEVIYSEASIKKIKKYINWVPRISIEKGINNLIKNEK
jgi:nucleoside-diphosphate-sugar epimerase